MNLHDTLTTVTKLMHVFGCKGTPMHISSGLHILRVGRGYVCPECGNELLDITNSPVGRVWFAHVRPDLFPPK